MFFDIIHESDEQKAFKFKGIAMIKNSISGNGRRYSGELVEGIVKTVKDIIESTGSYPLSVMADHPGIADNKTLTTVGKVVDMYMDGDNAIIEAEIANTTFGKDVQELIRGKFVEGLSIRASKAKMKKVNIDGRSVNDVLEMELNGVDLVTNPGVKGAKVLDILESDNSGVYVSIENEEVIESNEEDIMDYSKITLEELKAKRSDLIEGLKEEFKPVIESELGVNELTESVNNLETEKTDLEVKLKESEEKVTELTESVSTKETELGEVTTKLTEAQKELTEIKESEQKAIRDAHIAESISNLKFADSVKEKIKEELSTLESVEEIDTKLAEKVSFLNMVIKESTGIDLSGEGQTGENGGKDSKIAEEEEFRKMVREN